MAELAQSTNLSKLDVNVITGSTKIRDIRNISHTDTLFKNSIARQHYLIHPDWNSELLTKNTHKPLDRPAWAWEQQRHSPNIQFPITYTTPRYEKEAPVQQRPIPYALQIGNQGEVTPTGSQAKLTYAVQDKGYYMKATVPRDTQPACFTMNDTKDFNRLTTTMKERERLPVHLHY